MKKELKQLEEKVRGVAQDLREPQEGAVLEHQAKKLDKIADDLYKLAVHGGGTGRS